MRHTIINITFLILLSIYISSCSSTSTDRTWMTRNVPIEPDWIRSGEPIEFEGEKWYPQDTIDNLLDSEVYNVGEYKGLQIFVEVTDVRPYDRLYTRFAKNRFRLFIKEK